MGVVEARLFRCHWRPPLRQLLSDMRSCLHYRGQAGQKCKFHEALELQPTHIRRQLELQLRIRIDAAAKDCLDDTVRSLIDSCSVGGYEIHGENACIEV
eukprot:CAMPEP_0115397154 /NCGR_PEP_ID=MMETSP0271-20121206/13660_1 /TAXON_ID=71861 /ORGANISM="Scrippsiella trochoidea, Strain CCMP3099" /LENGTH=98 /DNA_ID=CAMNT_0002820897 /DNA_START=54 /DNA_END=350 /DNA_ORIENTATION=-